MPPTTHRELRRVWIAAGAVLLSPYAVAPPRATAQDKSGVSPSTISRPSGPGSLEGLGDAFQPALNTGSGRSLPP